MTLLLKNRIHLAACHTLYFPVSLYFVLGSPPGSSLQKKMSSTCASALGVAACGALATGRQKDLVEVLSAAEREF